MDLLGNFIVGQLIAGPASGDSELSLSLGQGGRFPAGAATYNLTLYDSLNYSSAGAAYWAGRAEIVRVTNRSGDLLSVTRAQEGTSAVNFTGLAVTAIVAITAKTLNDILLSLPITGLGSPEGVQDGNLNRSYLDLTGGEVQEYKKTTGPGILTGWI